MGSNPFELETQIRSLREYDDTLGAGSGLESPAGLSLQDDLHSIISQMKRMIGLTNWYDALAQNAGLADLANKLFTIQVPPIPGTTDFTLGSAVAGVLVPTTMIPGGSGTIAVGAASTADKGYNAADESNFTAGTLGVGLSEIRDSVSTLLNKVGILDAATNDSPTTNGEPIFGLLQASTGTSDGAAIVANPSENLQISFVQYDPATDAIISVTLPAGTYHFSLPQRCTYFALPAGAFTSGSGLPALVLGGGIGSLIPKVPFKEFDITAGAVIVAGDPLNIVTGSFTTAGARTTLVSSDGTVALPASGALFQGDSRIKVWVNGKNQSKGTGGGTPREAYWVSSTQIAFDFKIFAGNVIHIEMPASY